MHSGKCGIWTTLYWNFRKCGTRFYPVRSGAVRYKVLVMAPLCVCVCVCKDSEIVTVTRWERGLGAVAIRSHSKVKRYLMNRNLYNQIPHPTLKPKRKTSTPTNWQTFTKDTYGKPNGKLFPKQVVIQLPELKTAATSIFAYFLF